MAPSPASTMPSIIWRTDCATSGSAGSSQRNDRSLRMEATPRIGGQPLEHGVGDQQIFLGRDRVLQQAVGHDHIRAMQLLDISQSLARELAVMDDELQLEDADVGAGVAGACRHGLHIAQPAMKIDKSSLQG